MLKRRKRITQKLLGIALIAISVLYIAIASTGTTLEERDCTAVFFTIPLGLVALFSKSVFIQ
jgi:hypothetical protein